ncbi:cysteine proteinase [Hypoxylon sp. FL1150]|nr:cysteine proteinase [Hypoxylon sp. FL1150]
MFQPQPTPFSTYGSYGIHVANAEVPEYAFQPTPLGFGTGHAGGAVAVAGSSGVGVGAGVGAGGPADIYASHIFHPNLIPANNHLPYNAAPHQTHSHRIKMEPRHPNDLAQQEAAAREYKPQLQGPLVGDRRPSTEITEEYAKADPTYVAKTMALPQTYSHYRPIQGDGNCGWRAIAFGYFEILAGCGDINHAQGELARLTSLNTYIENVGERAAWIFEDMVSETFDLLSTIIGAISSGQDAMPFIMDKFNDAGASHNLMYHMRLLASSYLKGHLDQYEPYLDTTVANYIEGTMMPVDREIDHLSVVLLFEILLKPAGMVLEIAYLDRSEGHEANVHRMPEEANGQDVLGPIIYLLYRPGHYDILYRDSIIQPPPMPPAPTSLQVNRVSFTQQPEIENTISPLQDFSIDMSALALIPGFAAPEMSPLGSPPAAPSPMSDPYAPSPQSPWMAQSFSDGLAAAPPPAPQPSPPQQQPPPTPMTVHPLRFSKYNFPDLVETSTFHEPAFTTNTFKNSHFNVAHYNNMNFQPEMYRPDADDEIPHAKERGGRKRSTEHCAVIKKENRG